MTVYTWTHWFWITLYFNYGLSNTAPSTFPTESQQMTSVPLPSADRSSLKIAGKEINIPPVTIPSSLAPTKNITRSPFKFHKVDVRKHEKKQIINVTSHPLIKETTVIDENSANFMSNVTDSEMINSSINAINLTYLETENHTTSFNRTEISGNLSAAGITGITMGCVSFVGIICAVSFVIYRNRGLNRPQVLNDRCSNPDSSGYIDDASIRDNSEEMYSLDNDSFLNSLEAMTIQNYWTDTVKHTKL